MPTLPNLQNADIHKFLSEFDHRTTLEITVTSSLLLKRSQIGFVLSSNVEYALLEYVFETYLHKVIVLFIITCLKHGTESSITVIYSMYVCPCIIYEIDERYPLDATIYLLL